MTEPRRELPRYLVLKIIFLIVSMSFPFGFARYAARRNVHKSGEVKVVKVFDGDTILVHTGEGKQKVRLLGIDAPEIKSNHISKGQPYGMESARLLEKMVEGKFVKLKPVATDKYGRLLARVFLKGKDIGLEIVKTGLAWRDSSDARYKRAQISAQTGYRGLWADPKPLRPHKWRKLYRLEVPNPNNSGIINKQSLSY